MTIRKFIETEITQAVQKNYKLSGISYLGSIYKQHNVRYHEHSTV